MIDSTISNVFFQNVTISKAFDNLNNPDTMNSIFFMDIDNSIVFLLQNFTFLNNSINGTIFLINLEETSVNLLMKDFYFKGNNYTINGFCLYNILSLSMENFLSISNNMNTNYGCSCIEMNEVFELFLSNLSLIQCQSTCYAPGLYIDVAGDSYAINHTIINCLFKENLGNFTDSISQSAVYLSYNIITANLSIINSTFQLNDFQSAFTETQSSSALVMIGSSLNVTIIYCLFLNNTSSDISSAIFFSLNSIIALYNYFSGNTYTDDSNFYGTLYTGAMSLYFYENLFIENQGVDGACIKVYEVTDSALDIYLIDRIIVINNYASYQAGFMSRDAFQASDVTISNSYFFNNSGSEYSGCFYLGSLYNTPQINIYIVLCLFFENNSDLSGGVLYASFSGENIAVYFNQTMFCDNYLYDLTSIYPQGGMSDIWGYDETNTIYFIECLSFNNRASNGGFLSMVVGSVIDEGSTYIENYAAMLGGNYFLSSDVYAEYINSTFLGNYAKLGGSFFVHDNSELTISDCHFEEIYAERGGVFMLDLSSFFTFQRMTIQNINGDLGALLYLTNTNSLLSVFEDSEVSESQSTISLIYSEQADLTLSSLRFYSINSTIYHFQLSFVSVYNNLVNNVRCIDNGEGCIINVFRTDSFLFQDCIIINMTRENTYDGGFVYAMESTITLLNVSLENIDSQQENSYGPIILGSSSEILIRELWVLNFAKGGFSLTECLIIIYNSSIENTNQSLNLYQDVVTCQNCLLLVINNTRFAGLQFIYAQMKSVISINSYDPSEIDPIFITSAISLRIWFPQNLNYNFLLDSNNFIENNSSQATVIYIYDTPEVIIKSSLFLNNMASNFAGCIYLSFDTNSIITNVSSAIEILILNNTFSNNWALNEGGVLKWIASLSPTLSNNQYINNSAIYGPEIASLPVRLAFRVYNSDDIQDSSDSDIESIPIFSSLLTQDGFIINNQMSGDTAFCSIEMQLVDDRNQAILEANSRAEAYFVDGLSYLQNLSITSRQISDHCPDKYGKNIDRFNLTCNSWLLKTISGFEKLRDLAYINNKTTPVSLDLTLQKNNSDNRIYNLAERIVLTNTPSTYGFLILSSNMIIPSFYALISIPSPNEFIDPSTGSYALIIPVFFRACNPGENYDNDTNTCSVCVKNKYSFNPFNNGCSLCPPNAECNGSMDIILNPGYWRSSIYSDQIYGCEVSLSSCLGTYNSTCLEGYIGRLCDVCVDASINNKNIFGLCERCLGKSNDFVVFFVFFLVTMVILGYYSGDILLFNQKKTEEIYVRKIAFKILLNFLQTFALMPVDNVPMPRFMFYYYKLVALSIYSLEKWIGTGCFNGHFAIVNSRSHNTLLIYFMALLLMAFLMLLYWRTRFGRLYKEDPKEFQRKCLKGIVFLMFYFQPSLLTLAFKAFSCVAIEGKSYAKLNMEQECWTDDYTLITVCFNSMIIFGFFLVFPLKPYYYYYLIYKKKIQPKDFKEIIQNHYIFLGYRKNFAYWELLVFARKLILIVYVSLVDADGNSIAIAILILNISHLLQLYFKPYKSERLNQFENNAYFVVTLNYYFLLFFYIEDTNENMDIALFIISVLAIVIFTFMTIQIMFYKKFEEKFRILSRIFNRLKSWKGATKREKVFDSNIAKKDFKKI